MKNIQQQVFAGRLRPNYQSTDLRFMCGRAEGMPSTPQSVVVCCNNITVLIYRGLRNIFSVGPPATVQGWQASQAFFPLSYAWASVLHVADQLAKPLIGPLQPDHTNVNAVSTALIVIETEIDATTIIVIATNRFSTNKDSHHQVLSSRFTRDTSITPGCRQLTYGDYQLIFYEMFFSR